MLTERGRSPNGVSITGQFPAPVSFELVTSSLKQTSEFCWIYASTGSSEAADPRMSKSSNGCRSALGRSCGCVLLFRYAKELQDESSYG